MNTRRIRLARKLAINCIEDAQQLNIQPHFEAIAKHLASLGTNCRADKDHSMETPLPSINHFVNKRYRESLYRSLKGVLLVKNVIGQGAFGIERVEIKLKSFQASLGLLEFNIMAITEHLELVDIYGEFALLKRSKSKDKLLKLDAVKLSDTLMLLPAKV
ncbi:hypothetical protein [Mucilaginibacter antarcticus]|uniref:Uncharacterized protein n=1 Tax=Mucilaginibacter antarcticus TaxID=1855725 RepID=A0ABW5XS88_9SPHI